MEGAHITKQFAKKGDKIGHIEFSENGKNSKHDLNVYEYDSYGSAYGTSTFRIGRENLQFDLSINTNREEGDENVASMAITIGHESFLHIDQYLQSAVDAFDSGDKKLVKEINEKVKESGRNNGGDDDHKGYINGGKPFAKMRNFIKQLSGVLKKEDVNRETKDHDSKYKKLKTK